MKDGSICGALPSGGSPHAVGVWTQAEGVSLHPGVTKDEDGSGCVRGYLKFTKGTYGAGGFGVVILILDAKAWRGGVADDEGRTEFPGYRDHTIHPRAVVGKNGRLTHAKIGGKCIQRWTPHAPPRPAKVGRHGSWAVFFIKVEHSAGDGSKPKERLAGGYGNGKGVAESGFTDSGDASKADEGLLVEEVFNKPLRRLRRFSDEGF